MSEEKLLELIRIGQETTYTHMQPLLDKLTQYQADLNNDIINYCIKEFQWQSETKDCEVYFQSAHYKLMQELYRLARFTPIRALSKIPIIPSQNPYLNYIVELALKEEPRQVKIENWSPSLCPTCGYELSTNNGDGYYTHPTYLEHCPYCRQRLLW